MTSALHLFAPEAVADTKEHAALAVGGAKKRGKTEEAAATCKDGSQVRPVIDARIPLITAALRGELIAVPPGRASWARAELERLVATCRICGNDEEAARVLRTLEGIAA